jgi:hypothetical protein
MRGHIRVAREPLGSALRVQGRRDGRRVDRIRSRLSTRFGHRRRPAEPARLPRLAMIRSTSLRLVLAASCAGVACLAAGEASAQDSTHAAALRLPRLFGDGMVLQRGVHIPVWGWAPPRARVHVALDGADADATAAVAGRWKVTLPAHSAGGPHRLAVRAGSDSVVLHDVLVGDVWIASGQSNMELPVSAARGRPRTPSTSATSARLRTTSPARCGGRCPCRSAS